MSRLSPVTFIPIALIVLAGLSEPTSARESEPFPGFVALPESSRLRNYEEDGEADYVGPEIHGTMDGKLLVTYVYPYLILDDVEAPNWLVLEHFAINAATQMSCEPQADGRSTISDAWINPTRTVMVLQMMHRCILSDSSESSTFVVQLPAAKEARGWHPHKREVKWLQLEDRVAQLEFLLQRLDERRDHDKHRYHLANWKERRAEFLRWWEPRFPKHATLRKVRALRFRP